MAEIRGDTNRKRQYYDDEGNHIAELDDMLDDLTASVDLTLRPFFPLSFNTENEFSKLDSIESEITRRNISNKKVLYSHFTYDENNLPKEIRHFGVKITRDPLLFITVTKDAHGKLQYSAERRNADGSYTAIDNYNPNAARFTGLVDGRREIKLEEQIFLYDDDVKDDLLRQFPPEQLKLDKQKTLSHELQHISNKIKIAQTQYVKPKSKCSIADYYRLCFYDEISASLKPLLEEIKAKQADGSHNNTSYQWFYDAITRQGKDVKNIRPQEILQTLVAYWNQQLSDGYAKKNSQFFENVQGFVKFAPWASYQMLDGSEDYLKSLKAMLTIDDVDYSKFLSSAQDPISAHKNQLEYTLSDGTPKNWLQELEEQAREIRRKAAKYGLDEEIAIKLKDKHTIYPLTTKAPFEPQELGMPQEEPVDDNDRTFYKVYFKTVARQHGLQYEEPEPNLPVYKVNLKNPQNGNTTHISINNSNNITMTATNSNGQTQIPDQARFDDIVNMVKQRGSFVNFGTISSNDYKARLYLACLKAGVEMKNQPELNAEFLSSVELKTKNEIANIVLAQTKKQCQETIEQKLNRPLQGNEEINAFCKHCETAFRKDTKNYPINNISGYQKFALNEAQNIDENKLQQYVSELKEAEKVNNNIISTVKRLEEEILPKIEQVAKDVSQSDDIKRQQPYGYHGFEHSELVALRAIDCAKSISHTSPEDLLAVTLAAAIHDSMRKDDKYDENHGKDAASQQEVIDFVKSFGLPEETNKLILSAAEGHTTDNPKDNAKNGNWIRDCLCDADRARLSWEHGFDEQHFFTKQGKILGSFSPDGACAYLKGWENFYTHNNITPRYGPLTEKYKIADNKLSFVKREQRPSQQTQNTHTPSSQNG